MSCEIVITETPNWLKALEEKREKRLHRKLGHEMGAGAPCLTCGDTCPGLDLHFWRKICKNCKCPKENHEVDDDDIYGWAQDELLGRKPNKLKRKIVLPGRKDEVELEWSPAGQNDTVDKYLKTLPSEQLPIKGSQAAQDRKQLLKKQIPIHDIDPTLCHELTDQELKQMHEYISHIKDNSVGVGHLVQIGKLEFSKVPKNISTNENVIWQPGSVANLKNVDKQMKNLQLNPNNQSNFNTIDNQQPINVGIHNMHHPLNYYDNQNVENANQISAIKNLPLPSDFMNNLNQLQSHEPLPNYAHIKFNTYDESQNPLNIGGMKNLEYNDNTNRYGNNAIPNYSSQNFKNVENSEQNPLHSHKLNNIQYDQNGKRVLPHHFPKDTENINNLQNSTSPQMRDINYQGSQTDPNCAIHDGDLSSQIPNSNLPEYNPALHQLYEFNKNNIGKNQNLLPHHFQKDAKNISNDAQNFLNPQIRDINYQGSQTNPNFGRDENSSREYLNSDSNLPKYAPGSHHLYGDTQGSFNPQIRDVNYQGSETSPNFEMLQSGNIPYQGSHKNLPSHTPGRHHLYSDNNPQQMKNIGNDAKSPFNPQIRDVNHPGSQTNPGIPQGSSQGSLNSDSNLSHYTPGVHHIHDDKQNPQQLNSIRDLASSTYNPEYNPDGSIKYPAQNQMPFSTNDLARLPTMSNDLHPKGHVQRPLPSYAPGNHHRYENDLKPALVHIGGINDIDYQYEVNNPDQNIKNHDENTPVDNKFEINKPEENLPRCHGCKNVFKSEEIGITISNRAEAIYHPNCFKCHSCNQELADMFYFYDQETDNVYCGRDYAKIRGIPRCRACDELIFVKEYCLAENNTFHVKHFCCFECDTPLAGQNYVVENSQPLCLPCYELTKANKCFACSKPIGPDEQGLQLKDGVHFHATENCFACKLCRKSLFGAKLLFRNDKLYCSHDCFNSDQK